VAIVVGVDGSAESVEALRWAIEEARLRKTAVRAVHVWQYPLATTGDPFSGPGFDPLPIEPGELRELAATLLANVVGQATANPEAVEQELVEGHPAETLVGAGKDAELLVVGSRGHGGFSGLLLGSVSQACAHHARCPVVVVRGSADAPKQ
jgi:nucleotide-binding universal stress UspA family protein